MKQKSIIILQTLHTFYLSFNGLEYELGLELGKKIIIYWQNFPCLIKMLIKSLLQYTFYLSFNGLEYELGLELGKKIIIYWQNFPCLIKMLIKSLLQYLRL